MTFILDERSKVNLEGVHRDLVDVIVEAMTQSPHRFIVTEGIGHAVDIAVYNGDKITWDFKYYQNVADHIKSVAKKRNIEIVWGGDWESFKDALHFELR